MSQPATSFFVALYTDEDVTDDLAPALRRRGYDVQSTAEAGNLSLSDEEQLRYAAEQGKAILTYNIEDFISLGPPMARTGDRACGHHFV